MYCTIQSDFGHSIDFYVCPQHVYMCTANCMHGIHVCTCVSVLGPVAVKKLNVSNPNEQQMQAFKNEVGVLM